MRPISDNKYGSSQEDAVSPLSYRSDDEIPMNGGVSPLASPTRPQPLAASSSSQYQSPPDEYAIPQRKPVGESKMHDNGTVGNGRLAMHDSSSQIPSPTNGSGPSSKDEEKLGQCPQSQSFRALEQQDMHVLPQILQNHADHTRAIPHIQAATVSTKSRGRPRSQNVPPAPRHQAIPLERRICAHCGRPQKENPIRFLRCSRCVNIYYCADGRCWAERVCHNRSGKDEQTTPPPPSSPPPLPQQTFRPQYNPEWKMTSRPHAQATTAQRNAGTRSPMGTRCVRDGHLTDLESQKPSPERRGRDRTLWLVLAAVICLILIIIVVVIATKH